MPSNYGHYYLVCNWNAGGPLHIEPGTLRELVQFAKDNPAGEAYRGITTLAPSTAADIRAQFRAAINSRINRALAGGFDTHKTRRGCRKLRPGNPAHEAYRIRHGYLAEPRYEILTGHAITGDRPPVNWRAA
jgi:hypothetical protein